MSTRPVYEEMWNKRIAATGLNTQERRHLGEKSPGCKQINEESERCRSEWNATMAAANAVSLRVMSGVPVVEVLGDWAPSVMDSLTNMIGTLAEAGHNEI